MEHIFEEHLTNNNVCNDKHNITENKGTNKVSDNIFANIQKYSHEEYQYLNLLREILQESYCLPMMKRSCTDAQLDQEQNISRYGGHHESLA